MSILHGLILHLHLHIYTLIYFHIINTLYLSIHSFSFTRLARINAHVQYAITTGLFASFGHSLILRYSVLLREREIKIEWNVLSWKRSIYSSLSGAACCKQRCITVLPKIESMEQVLEPFVGESMLPSRQVFCRSSSHTV